MQMPFPSSVLASFFFSSPSLLILSPLVSSCRDAPSPRTLRVLRSLPHAIFYIHPLFLLVHFPLSPRARRRQLQHAPARPLPGINFQRYSKRFQSFLPTPNMYIYIYCEMKSFTFLQRTKGSDEVVLLKKGREVGNRTIKRLRNGDNRTR